MKSRRETIDMLFSSNYSLGYPALTVAKEVIRGTVFDTFDVGVAGAAVSVDGREVAVTDANGNYEVEIQPGTHTVTAQILAQQLLPIFPSQPVVEVNESGEAVVNVRKHEPWIAEFSERITPLTICYAECSQAPGIEEDICNIIFTGICILRKVGCDKAETVCTHVPGITCIFECKDEVISMFSPESPPTIITA